MSSLRKSKIKVKVIQNRMPYKKDGVNQIYELLFCDDVELYRGMNTAPDIYPWNILFDENADSDQLERGPPRSGA